MKKGVISVLSVVTGAIIGASAVGKVVLGEKEKVKSISDKHLALFQMMNQWVKVKQDGKSLSEYFEKNGYKIIAIYGMSYVGETLVNELRDTQIKVNYGIDKKVNYGIDKKVNSIYADLDIFSPEDDLGEVDAVVVTAITFFDEIAKNLSEKMECPIISLVDILYEV